MGKIQKKEKKEKYNIVMWKRAKWRYDAKLFT